MGRCVPAWLGLTAVAAIIAVAACGQVSQPASIKHKIYASRDWQSIGMQVHPGDKIAVRAHGAWLYTPGEYHGPQGHARYLAPSFYPAPGVPGGVLLARIGEVGQPLVVGRSLKASSPIASENLPFASTTISWPTTMALSWCR